MKTALAIAVPLGVFLTLVAWRLSQILSPDAIALALGLTLGVIAGIPTLALVTLARRRDEEDDWQPTVIDYPMPPAVTYADQVTLYTRLARRAMQLPALPDRQAMAAPQLLTRREIADMRLYLDAVEAGEQ